MSKKQILLAGVAVVDEAAVDKQIGREVDALSVSPFDVQPEGTRAYRVFPESENGNLFEDASAALVAIPNDEVGIAVERLAREARSGRSAQSVPVLKGRGESPRLLRDAAKVLDATEVFPRHSVQPSSDSNTAVVDIDGVTSPISRVWAA